MFKPQFATLVASGAKRQTIRPVPKRMPKVGDLESWRKWTGLPYRSPQVELAKVRLTKVKPITITPLGIKGVNILGEAIIMGRDGFTDSQAFIDWFKKEHGLPFSGILIRAEDHL